jgi:hypothetical protein
VRLTSAQSIKRAVMVVNVWKLDLQLPMQLGNQCLVVGNVVSLNPAQAGCTHYNIIHVIKFVSDMRQVSGFLQEHRFPPPIKLTAMI